MKLLDKLRAYFSTQTNQRINQRILRNITKITGDISSVNTVIGEHFIPVIRDMLAERDESEYLAARKILKELNTLRKTANILSRTCDKVNYWVNQEFDIAKDGSMDSD